MNYRILFISKNIKDYLIKKILIMGRDIARPGSVGQSPAVSSLNSSSLNMVTPSATALSYFEPGFSPTTT